MVGVAGPVRGRDRGPTRWPWAIYLMKTGDLAFVKAQLRHRGPAGLTEPSIEDTAHAIAADRTGPGGIMEATDDIDFTRLLDHRRLRGPHGSGRLPLPGRTARRPAEAHLGDPGSTTPSWPRPTRPSTRPSPASVSTISPVRWSQPNTANRCARSRGRQLGVPPFGRWAWDASLFGAAGDRPGPHADRRHLRLRVRPAAGHGSPRTPSGASPTTTTPPPTTPATGWPDWPATGPTATRGSWATSS